MAALPNLPALENCDWTPLVTSPAIWLNNACEYGFVVGLKYCPCNILFTSLCELARRGLLNALCVAKFKAAVVSGAKSV